MWPRTASAALLSLAIIAFSGCAQLGAPPQCLNATPDKLANCVYVNSVLEQSPYWCYSLSDMAQREKCLRDSTSPATQKELERMSSRERNAIFSETGTGAPDLPEAPIPKQPGQQPGTPLPPAPPQANTPAGAPPGISGEDARAFSKAVQENDMAPCVSISDKATRASCITQVALRVKKPSVCEVLAAQEDIDICNLYAKAGEQAK
jgi:hypothetical protein